MHHIYIMSDGTGQTAEQALRAALAQFSDHEVMIERRAGVRTATAAARSQANIKMPNGLTCPVDRTTGLGQYSSCPARRTPWGRLT